MIDLNENVRFRADHYWKASSPENAKPFWQLSFFSPKELVNVSGKVQMDMAFMRKVEAMREIAGFPFHVNSYWRTPEHNKAVGGKPNSLHLVGRAMDIKCPSNSKAGLMVAAALKVGMGGIGVRAHGNWNRWFVHVDDLHRSGRKPRIWTYD